MLRNNPFVRNIIVVGASDELIAQIPDALMVVTGDVTQIDLPDRTRSGLVDALQVLKGVGGIAQCYFTEKDVVRHRLVQEIIKAYEAAAHPAKR